MDRYEETSMRHLKVEMTHDFPPSLHLFPPLGFASRAAHLLRTDISYVGSSHTGTICSNPDRDSIFT